MMQADKNILTRGLPKTGQIENYRAGDDGQYEAGWWKGKLNANNKTRFTQKTIGGGDVTIDRATGLMWPFDVSGTGGYNGLAKTWNQAIDYAQGLVFCGFSDWRIPNFLELLSIVNFGEYDAAIYSNFFSNFNSYPYWSSTAYHYTSSWAWFVDFEDGSAGPQVKTAQAYLLCVRGGV